MRKAILLSSALCLFASFPADAQIIFQRLFYQPEPAYVVVQQRPYVRYDRHRNYHWGYWRQDSRQQHSEHENGRDGQEHRR